MFTPQILVRDFHLATGAVVHLTPQFPDFKTQALRLALHMEECVKEFKDALSRESLTDVADALADAEYVINGTAVSFGIDLEPIFLEVHRSNMSKVPDGYLREDGKWMKGPGHSPAQIEPLILEQIEGDEEETL